MKGTTPTSGPSVLQLNGGSCKTYLLWNGGEAILVDPLRERMEVYREALGTRGLRLLMVLETHMHADHLMMNRAARDTLGSPGAPVAMHRTSPSPLVDHHLDAGDVLHVGGAAVAVLHTPGHTPDSLSLHVPEAAGGAGAVFTGDTLLIGGSGRTDFPGGDAGAQYDAVTRQLFALPESTVVWPAHDYQERTSSTVGDERRLNARFVGRSRDDYVTLMGNLNLPFPDRIQEALQVNQSGCEACDVAFPKVADVAAVPEITAEDLATLLGAKAPPVILDVREPEEFVGELGHIQGAYLVPLDALERRAPRLSGYADRGVVVVCRAGARSATGGAMLARAGFRGVRSLLGGMLAWRAAGLPVQR